MTDTIQDGVVVLKDPASVLNPNSNSRPPSRAKVVSPESQDAGSKVCTGCQQTLHQNAKFCRGCGAPAPKGTPAPSSSAVPPRRKTDPNINAVSSPPVVRPPLARTESMGSANSGNSGKSAQSAPQRVSVDLNATVKQVPQCSMCSLPYTPPNAKFCSACGHNRGGTIIAVRGVVDEEMSSSCSGCGHNFPKSAVFCISCGQKRPEKSTGKTRQQLAEEANQDASYATIQTTQCTSLDLLKTFLNKKEILDGWTKGPLIGRGSFGSVYQGLLTNGGFVAVKQIELLKPNGGWEKEIKTLHRELSVMRMLDHPNVCRYLGAEYDGAAECLSIFLEYVTGGSLASLIKRFKLLPIAVVRGYTRDMLQGLAYLHGKGVIHRDIKGDNILVDEDKGMCKLADFGAAKKLVEKMSCATMIGTPYWMAPEVIMCPEGYRQTADVWSAGCTVVEMLTGKPPWPMASTPQVAMMMIAKGTPPTEVPTDIPESCKDFLAKCFVVDAAERATAASLLDHSWLLE